jgi:DNA-directed RNA polymerase alpha subunit
MDGWTETDRLAYRREKLLETPIADLDLPVRVVNTLEEHGVLLFRDLVTRTWDQLMAMRNFGEKTLNDVRRLAADTGLATPNWDRPPQPKKTRVRGEDAYTLW